MRELKLGGEGLTGLEAAPFGNSSGLGNGALVGTGHREIGNSCLTTPHMINLCFGGERLPADALQNEQKPHCTGLPTFPSDRAYTHA